MPKFEVEVPIRGRLMLEVRASDEEAAIKKAGEAIAKMEPRFEGKNVAHRGFVFRMRKAKAARFGK